MLSRRLLRVKVIKSLYAHIQSQTDNLQASKKNLVLSIDKAYELMFQLSSLAVELARYAEERQETARNKKLPTYEDLNPNRKFVENKAIARIAGNSEINDFISGHGLGWSKYPELVKSIYTRLTSTEKYKQYMASPQRSLKEDVELLTDFYTNELQNDEMLDDVLEEMSIMWTDDLGQAIMLFVRMLGSASEKHDGLKIPPKYKNSDDEEFAFRLFEQSVLQFARNSELIDRLTSNWDVERIAFMDIVIMAVAITEMKEFSSIPVRVTLDEYIEISKFYSTPNSSVFINGILDKAAEILQADGEIHKFGRGLI
ncbi:MAG: transcription antitermination protein NusB [Alistipes sp.]|nr:transcription antitermination protein NusB [Alistipes sp.]